MNSDLTIDLLCAACLAGGVVVTYLSMELGKLRYQMDLVEASADRTAQTLQELIERVPCCCNLFPESAKITVVGSVNCDQCDGQTHETV